MKCLIIKQKRPLACLFDRTQLKYKETHTMDSNKHDHRDIQGNPNEELATEIVEEKDDKPAGNTIWWAIIIAVMVLIAIYFIFFYDKSAPTEQFTPMN